jgi:heme-degrading monooxygenase HmoA
MILEIADIRVAPDRVAEFETALTQGAASIVPRASGYRSHRIVRGIETPERFVLMIWWDTLEDHTVGFRTGPLFAEWRAIVGPFFAQPPVVEHFEWLGGSPAG